MAQRSLRAFLSFVYDDGADARRRWSLLFEVLCRASLEDIHRQSDALYQKLVRSLNQEVLESLRQDGRQWFEATIKQLSAGKPYRAEGYALILCQMRLTSGEDIFSFGPVVPELKNPEQLLHELRACVVSDLMHLKCSALLRCSFCSRIFLRTDRRLARYCSDKCRYRFHERERRKPPTKGRRHGSL